MLWRKLMTEKDSESFLAKLTAHLSDTNNPHKNTAVQVGLGSVENLPVADVKTILSRSPKRQYITYDGVLLFMKAFITNNWQIDPAEDDKENQERSIRAYPRLFAPCGSCAPCEGITIENAPRETEKPVPVRGQEIGWHCEAGTKVVKITDGMGGYYVDEREYSTDCGFIPPNATFAIRDLNDTVLGYGFPSNGTVDPDATVRIDDADGNALCYIDPGAGIGRAAEIRNASGTTIGYAITP